MTSNYHGIVVGIAADVVYPVKQFLLITGWNRAGLRSARKTGLMVFYHGNRAFIRGSDFHEWIGTRPTEAPSAVRFNPN
jgi:hypothetical protein